MVIMASLGQGPKVISFVAMFVRAVLRLFGDARRNVVPEPYPSEQATQIESYADDMV
jgi:hypothetical protein